MDTSENVITYSGVIKSEYTITIGNAELDFMTEEFDTGANAVGSTFHTHGFTEVFVCHKHTISILTPDSRTVLNAGDIAFIPPGLIHCKSTNDPPESIWNDFAFTAKKRKNGKPDVFDCVKKTVSEKTVHVFRGKYDLCGIMERIYLKKTINGLLVPIYLSTIVSELSSDGGNTGEDIRENSITSSIDRLHKLEYILYTDYAKNLTAKNMAELLFVSPRQFSRIIMQRYGKRFSTVLTEKRLEVACELLSGTELTVSQIAARVGFASREVFYREFRKMYGMTALEYRNSNKIFRT